MITEGETGFLVPPMNSAVDARAGVTRADGRGQPETHGRIPGTHRDPAHGSSFTCA